MINFKKLNKIYFYIISFFILTILFCNNLNGLENKIVFKINDKAFTTIDLDNRIEYLDFVGNNSNLDEKLILEDFISANLFFEYFKKSNNVNNYNKKINEIFNNVIEINKKNKKTYRYDINKENLIFNIKIDFIRKIILENILNSNLNELQSSKNELDLIYKFNIKYINFNIKDIHTKKIMENLNILSIENVIKRLEENNINFFFKINEVNDINQIDERIKENILSNKKFFVIENKENISLIFIEKRFETLDGIIGELYSIRSIQEIKEKDLNCKNLSKNKADPNINNKEYQLTNLNKKLKESLVSINDYIKLIDNNENVYIVLCNLKFDKEILTNLNLNKLINQNVSKIEKKFISKYTKEYNLIINE